MDVYGLILNAPGVTSTNGQEYGALRHPHPTEAALLTAVEHPACWHGGLRLALAGLGQQACLMRCGLQHTCWHTWIACSSAVPQLIAMPCWTCIVPRF